MDELTSQPTTAEAVDEIIAAYVEAVDTGQAPDREEWLRLHPEAADALRAFLADQDSFSERVAPLRTSLSGESPAGSSPLSGGPLRLGAYEVLDEIARGGMGVVFKARHVPLNRFVALKMIRCGGLASAADLERFRHEAEAAAKLDHPNIVPIYDVGVWHDQPYFTMKLIEGYTLASWGSTAASSGEPSASRLVARLLACIARAVHYAHQRGILHRDLKPANVLLSGPQPEWVPYVTDFGLAKQVETAESLTQTGMIVGTPSYMAPEQAVPCGPGGGATVASDVYSLGAILYELLTGQPPFKEMTPLETLRQVVEQEPVAPRARCPEVPRDLDIICRKCLEKDPARRYGSADALADDLERFLRGEPIEARAAGLLERTWRWCRRKPALAAALALTCLSLVTGTVVSALFAVSEANSRRQLDLALEKVSAEKQRAEDNLGKVVQALAERDQERQRAEQNLRQAHQAIEEFYVRFHEQGLRKIPGLQAVEKELMQKALVHFRSFEQQKGSDPALRFDVARASVRVGDISEILGQKTEALPHYENAIALLSDLEKTDPANKEQYRRWLAAAHVNRGIVQRALGQEEAALASYQAAAELYRQQPEQGVERAQAVWNRALNLLNLSTLERGHGQLDLARQHCQEANKALRQLVEEFRAERDRRPPAQRGRAQEELTRAEAELARASIRLARLQPNREQAAEVLKLLEQARQTQEGILEKYPGVQEYRKDLAETLLELAQKLDSVGQGQDAVGLLSRAQGLWDKLNEENPGVPEYQLGLVKNLCQLGNVRRRFGQGEQALTLLGEAYERMQKLTQQHRDVASYQAQLGSCAHDLGACQLSDKQPRRALPLLDQAVRLRRALVRKAPGNTELRGELARSLARLGEVQAEVKHPDEAVARLREAIEEAAACVETAPTSPAYRRALVEYTESLARVQSRLGQANLSTWNAAQERYEQLRRKHPAVVDLQFDQANLLVSQARELRERNTGSGGRELLQKAQALMEPPVKQDPDAYLGHLAHLHFQFGLWEVSQKAPEAAQDRYRQAVVLQRRVVELNKDRRLLWIQASSSLGIYAHNLGRMLANAGQVNEAEEFLRLAVLVQRDAWTALPQHSGLRQALSGHYQLLADLLTQAGRWPEAVEAQLQRQKVAGKQGRELYQVGRDLARIATQSVRDKKTPSPAEQQECDRIADLALSALQQARAAGYHPVKDLRQDPALAVLRTRPGYKSLLSGSPK